MANRTERVVAPAGMTGIYVEPWSLGEIYAVAANWAQASCPVVVYGKDGWTNDECGRQVADFRHSDRDALEAIIRSAIAAGGDVVDDEEVEAILDDASDCVSAELDDMATMLERHGVGFSGDCSADTAQDWLDHGFDPSQVEKWVEANCWCPIAASQLRDAGFRPGVDELEYKPGEERDLGYGIDPMYALCNSDTSIARLAW